MPSIRYSIGTTDDKFYYAPGHGRSSRPQRQSCSSRSPRAAAFPAKEWAELGEAMRFCQWKGAKYKLHRTACAPSRRDDSTRPRMAVSRRARALQSSSLGPVAPFCFLSRAFLHIILSNPCFAAQPRAEPVPRPARLLMPAIGNAYHRRGA